MKNVVGYTRVSTEGQTGEDKYGIEAQKNDIREYCRANDMLIVRWYDEGAVSGSTDDVFRPELSKLLNGEIQNPPIEAVVVGKNDRLARNIENFYGFKYLLKRNNIDLISVAEDFGSAGIYQPVYEAISAAFAQLERSFITVRMSGGRTAKAAHGGYAGGRAPYGYRASKGSKKLTVAPEEAKVVRLIFQLREEGKTLPQIQVILRENGIFTRKGKEFQISSIKNILDNKKTYQGFYRYGKDAEWVRGQQEAILPKKTK